MSFFFTASLLAIFSEEKVYGTPHYVLSSRQIFYFVDGSVPKSPFSNTYLLTYSLEQNPS
jgi:hypothetical protein